MNKTEQRSPTEGTPSDTSAQDASVYGAERRMTRFFILSSLVLTVTFLAIFGKSTAFGFVVGAALAIFNFAWLERTARTASTTLAGNTQSKRSTGLTGVSLAFGTVARLALVTAVGYAIFRGSIQSFYGFLGGLGMPILAVFAEALYEGWNAVRHRS